MRKFEEEIFMKKYLILGVGFGGFIVGILFIVIIFICINRCWKMRYDNEYYYDILNKNNLFL